MPKFQFGKYAGLDYAEVPEDYLEYLVRTSETQVLRCKAELERRKIKVEDSYMAKIVATGYKFLSGNVSSIDISAAPLDQAKLQRARDALDRAIAAAAQPKTQP